MLRFELIDFYHKQIIQVKGLTPYVEMRKYFCYFLNHESVINTGITLHVF